MRKKAIVFLLVLLSIASISAENLQKVYYLLFLRNHLSIACLTYICYYIFG